MSRNAASRSRSWVLPAMVLLAEALLGTACGRTPEPPATAPAAPVLAEVKLPDLSRADGIVQTQARDRHTALVGKIKAGTTGVELGAAYGDMGMLLHAAEYFDAAEPCYLNAQTLMPMDARWPYYLALLYQATGQTPKAEAALQRTLQLEPDDVAALTRLGSMYLDRGDAAAAEPLFARAQARAPQSVATLAGLGQTALARNQPADAVRHFEAALTIDPSALSLHAPLANAYRALGKVDLAESHLKQWRNTALPTPDVRRQELDALLQSGMSYELRGVQALGASDWKGAAALFRQGIEQSTPGSTLRRSLHHKLGTALWMSGDTRGAIEQFQEVVRIAPPSGSDEPSAKASYSLGIVMASEGRDARAIEYLTRAVAYQPNYREAHLALGDALRRAGRPADALRHYQEVVRIDPRSAPARFGYAMSLVRLGRYVEARDWLSESAALQPDQPQFAHALARVLAAAPDARARDGRRALALAQQLTETQKTTDVGETLAMAMAEVGNYSEAVVVQRGVIDAARRAGLKDTASRMEQNLKLYESGRPSRTPWRDDDPVHTPGPPTGG